jgi:membrane peptidoglycan carboxypeptidase
VSNPDFSGSYWQDPAEVGSSNARSNGSYGAPGPRGAPRRPHDHGRARANGADQGGRRDADGYRSGNGNSAAGYRSRNGNGAPAGYGNDNGAPAGYRRSRGHGSASGDGYSSTPGDDRQDGAVRGRRRAGGRRARGRGDAADAPGGRNYPGSASQDRTDSGRAGRDPLGTRSAARDFRDRLDIRARLGAITGTGAAVGRGMTGAGPAAGRGVPGRAGLRPGQAYLAAPGQGGGDYDSFEDIVGYRDSGARASTAALRDRVGGARRAGTTGLPGRRGSGYPAGDGGYGGGSGDGRDGGAGPRRKGSWWRHWTWKKALAVVAGTGAAMVLLLVLLVLVAYAQTPIPTEVSEAALQQSSTVYFANGKSVVGAFSTGHNRQLLTSAQIPVVLKDAAIAAEDRHFYTEGGISPTGIVRAGYEDFTGGTFQGGSTITQQFVRNYYANVGTAQTLSRKLKEIFVAIKLSHSESKDWILTQYLNTVYLGDNAYGVGAAAQTYFNKPAWRLNVAQSAMLAAMINEPGYFNPRPHSGQAHAMLVARWHYVLTNMVRDGAITQQRAAAQKFPKIVSGPVNNGWSGYRGYIMQAVESELENTYGYTSQDIFTHGLKIVTTFSEPMMNSLYKSIALEKHQMAADGRPLPWYMRMGAVLEKPGSGAILAMYGGPDYNARHCKRVACQYNMALQSSNQVGSSFKPYVLATAVSQGMNVQNSVLNGYSPIWIPPDWTQADRLALSTQTKPANPYGYWEFNEANENSGPLPVAKAAAISSDPAFEDLTHRVGVQKVLDMARKFGVAPREMKGLEQQFGPHGTNAGSVTVSLGQGDLTVQDQANLFAVLASGGQYATPHVIAQITQAGRQIPLKIVHRQVLTPAEAADVDYALSFDTVPGGTGYPSAAWDRPVIAKTGTTNNARSAFFIGAIPQYSFAVGMFTQNQSDHTTQTLDALPVVPGQTAGGFGGGWPATIWHAFMTDQFAQLPVQQLPTPDYTGFTKWVQVMQQPKHKQPRPGPGQPCGKGPGRHRWKQCQTPPPPTPNPTPTASCTPAPGTPCPAPSPSLPPGPGPATAFRPAAEEPAPVVFGGG